MIGRVGRYDARDGVTRASKCSWVHFIASLRCANAASVCACDTDADARLATSVNASINAVSIDVFDSIPSERNIDMILMADVLYDKANLPLLTLAQNSANEVLVADSRITRLPDPSYMEIARIDALTCPNLGEFDEFRTAHVFHWQRAHKPPPPDAAREL